MSGSAVPIPSTLSAGAILTRLKTVDGVDSGLDADQVRGRAQPTDAMRFDPYGQQFMPPPDYTETLSLSIFGV